MESRNIDTFCIGIVSGLIAIPFSGDNTSLYFMLAVPLSIGLIFAWEVYLRDRKE